MSLPSLLDLRSASLSVDAMDRFFKRGEHAPTNENPFGISESDDKLQHPWDDLTLLQRIALLGMIPGSTLARGVAKRIASNEGVQAKASIHEYRDLRDRGLAFKFDGERYHVLTPEGLRLARNMLMQYCHDLDIHILTSEPKGSQSVYKCSCGGWSRIFNGNGQFTWRRASNQFRAHYTPDEFSQ